MNSLENTAMPAPEPTEVRPWGAFWVLEDLPTHKVKRLQVKPGQRLSLQYHHHREEHWLVVVGDATITLNERTWVAKPGEYIHIKQGDHHRLANASDGFVEIVEIQQGSYFGEDDIVRLQDDYQRDPEPKQ
jgi:mannose-6-phosphate isomerase-like protein (cupin superfamily)